jgi:ATP-dependent helicase/nuclease subunit A
MNSRGARGGRVPSRPEDRDAREKIVRELDTTFLVEAGAGSGKTKSLVDRMIALVASGRVTIRTMAAVTFTRKAAAELRGRFQVALERSLRSGDGGWGSEGRERLAEALRNLEQGFVGTIHSFCAGLLRERPVEVGIDPGFEEMDDLEDIAFRDECWRDFLAEVRVENERILSDLEEVGLSPEDLTDSFAAVSLYPEVRPVPGRAAPPDFASVRDKLEGFIDSVAGLVPGKRPDKGFDDLQFLFRRLTARRRNLGTSDPGILMETLEFFEKKPGQTKNRWPSKETADEAAAAFRSFGQAVAFPALRAWREHRHTRVLEFLRLAADFHAKRRRSKSLLNFQDQLLLAAELVRENPEVRNWFRERFRAILVDEFQDTDPIQAEILFLLAGNDPEERDWTKAVPERGSLFLVGDPKQSIYRFRRADIDIYNSAKERILAGGGEVLELTANYRSLGCITSWANAIFREVFAEGQDGRQARFSPLNPERRGSPEAGSGLFRITVPKVDRNREKDIAERDAEKIGQFISRAVSGGLEISRRGEGEGDEEPAQAVPADFLVLFRFKKNMDIYARELERLGIPYEISGSESFSDSGEIGEIIRLLGALRDPGDPVLTVGVLRGIFFGASDQDLLEFRDGGGRFSFSDEDLIPDLPSGRVKRALSRMGEWWRKSKTAPPSVLLETVLEDSGLLPALVSMEMGSTRAGNVLKLVEVVRAREKEGAASLAAVAGFVEKWMEAQALEEMSLTPGRRNAVRLMNLHKAKGLEAPVVILANPFGGRDHEPEKHIVRTAGGEKGRPSPEAAARREPAGYFLFKKKRGWQRTTISQPADWEAATASEQAYDDAEKARLLYVAATRARDILVVSTYAAGLGERRAWGILDDGLEGLPELEDRVFADRKPAKKFHGAEPGAPPRRPLSLGKQDLLRARTELVRRTGRASRAGFLTESVTSLSRSERRIRRWEGGGMGLSWGTAVHALLGAAGRAGPAADLLLLARNALVAAGREPGEDRKLAALVRSILASDFWARALRSERRFFEVPFSVKIEPRDPRFKGLAARADLVAVAGGRPLAAAAHSPLFVSGAIDLAFREKDGWVIADYKTDAVPAKRAGTDSGPAEQALDALVEDYAPQVELYSFFWETVTGEPVKETGLYFTSAGVWRRIG